MTRLYVLVEGQSEEEFIKGMLAPHLQSAGIWVYTIVVETSRDAFGRKRRGGGLWKHWSRDLHRLTSQQRGAEVRFTTMFDLYGLPDDFPDLAALGALANTTQRADRLEAAMAASVGDHRLIPHIQRHEFESLVLAALDSLEKLLEDAADLAGLSSLRELMLWASPEDVNDGRDTAPSKRLEAKIPTYRKTVHGPLAVAGTGLPLLRSRCPRFNAWIARLEALGGPQS